MKDANEPIAIPKMADWVLKNKNTTLASLLAVFAFLFLLFRTSDHKTYYEAEKAANLWLATKEEKSLETLLDCIKKKPKLKEKYTQILTNSYLKNNDMQSLQNLRDQSYYLKKEFPNYEAFSKVSLLMEEGKYNQALEKTLGLKEVLKKEEKTQSLLYNYNELRLATIYQKLGNKEKELLVYENIDTKFPLSEKELSFSDYIKNRKEKLRS